MGALSIEKVDHLLWLGRYMERSYTTQRFIIATYDRALDSTEGNWKGQLEELGFDAQTETPRDFFRACLFDAAINESVAHSMDAAYDNAVRLRDVLGTETLSYIQMAYDALVAAKLSDAPLLDLQLVQDNIMAFKGCVDDFVDDDAARNIIKCGISCERIDLYARLGFRLSRLRQEVHRLASRINRTGAPYDEKSLKALVDIVFADSFPQAASYEQLGQILYHTAHLFSAV